VTIPSLNVTISREGQVCVLAASGELDIATAPDLTQQAEVALRQPPGRLILDLSGLEFVDCAGVRALAAVTGAAPPGCPVLVRGVGRRARRILDLLAVSLERPGAATPGRGEWLFLESQVLMSWAEQVRSDSRALVAEARQARSRRNALRTDTRLAIGPRA
jgi:anti-sigma B factor antagonist